MAFEIYDVKRILELYNSETQETKDDSYLSLAVFYDMTLVQNTVVPIDGRKEIYIFAYDVVGRHYQIIIHDHVS